MNSFKYVKPLKISSYAVVAQNLNREKIIERLQFYGFIECAKCCAF